MFTLIRVYLKYAKPKMRKFGDWVKLEHISAAIIRSMEDDIKNFPVLLLSYLVVALRIPYWMLERISWSDSFRLYYLALSLNKPIKIPFISGAPGKKDKTAGWDYDGRDWPYWIHILSGAYGWTVEYIHQLDVNLALSLIQEILTQEQLDREFVWSTTEVAYPYNAATKESKFSPLTRPSWMHRKAEAPKRIKIPKAMWPVGLVNDTSGMEKYFEDEKATVAS